MQDSGNEFHTLGDAYEHTVAVLVDLPAKLKLVTFYNQLLSALKSNLYIALAKSELKLIQAFKYVGAKQFVRKAILNWIQISLLKSSNVILKVLTHSVL